MKKIISILAAIILLISSVHVFSETQRYCINEIQGTVKVKGVKTSILKKGAYVNGTDILSTEKPVVVKINDDVKSYTLQFKGTYSVKDLIDRIPNKYVQALSKIGNNLKRKRTAPEYGMVTMSNETDEFELNENEAFLFCKEDSIGKLSIVFMRYGMAKPMKMDLTVEANLYLLKMAIFTISGLDYAYSTDYIYNVMWKPLEKYFKPGDTVIYSIPVYLTGINMDQIQMPDGNKLKDKYTLFKLD